MYKEQVLITTMGDLRRALGQDKLALIYYESALREPNSDITLNP